MSIYINSELAPHDYERTLIHAENCGWDSTIVWIEGTNMKLSFKSTSNNRFGIAGGPINTNSGIKLTKENLLEIANKMKEGAVMRICGCNSLDIEEVKKEFEHSNNMVKCGPHSFKPKTD